MLQITLPVSYTVIRHFQFIGSGDTFARLPVLYSPIILKGPLHRLQSRLRVRLERRGSPVRSKGTDLPVMLSMLRRAWRVCAVKMWFLGEEVFPSKQEERKTSAPAGKTSTLKQSILSQILTSTLLVHFPSPDLYWPSFR